MEIYLLALFLGVAFTAAGVMTVKRLYDTPGHCDEQSSMAARELVTVPEIQRHGVRPWVDDGGACIDGEVLP